jgi:hypothetical protein
MVGKIGTARIQKSIFEYALHCPLNGTEVTDKKTAQMERHPCSTPQLRSSRLKKTNCPWLDFCNSEEKNRQISVKSGKGARG